MPLLVFSRVVLATFALVLVTHHATGLAQEATVPSRYYLGVAKIDISPEHPVLLSGYAGRSHELTRNVVQPLHARAIVIGGDDPKSPAAPHAADLVTPPVVLISVDNCTITPLVRNVVAKELNTMFGIEAGRLTIAVSHTHSGPMLVNSLGNLLIRDQTPAEHEACDRYTQQLVRQLIEVVGQAWENRQWVTLQRNQGAVDFAINRRGGQVVDHQLPLLVALNEQQQPVLLLTNYACHCVSAGSGLEICGDWAAYASQSLETTHPTATAMVLIGCGADQNPAAMGGIVAAQNQGEALASEVQALLEKPKQPVQGSLEIDYREINLPLAPLPTREQWELWAQEPGIIGFHAQKNLRRLDSGEALPTSVDYPIQTWRFGRDLAMVFLGGEVVVDYVHLLRQRIDPDRLWVTAYANAVPCYIPSQRILREGGYEGGDAMVWYDLPTRLTEETEPLILNEVQSQLGAEFTQEHDTTRTGGTWPKSPQASLDAMKTHPEFRIELVASEPLICDPVAIDFGPDGRLWVVQMNDYPEGLDGKYQAGGSVRVLTDTTGDGHYDSAITFLDKLPFPTDVKVWRDGVLICAAPDVLFARDTTGDGRADEVVKVLTGFQTHNYQARVNSLTWGLDHWVYGAAGIFGGMVKNAAQTEIDLNNRDFRFQPDQGIVEAVSGRTQQGRVRDDWGNWFGCENGALLWHYPATEHYARRNPSAPNPPTVVGVPQSNRLFPPAQTIQWALSGPKGLPTSACGVGIFRSDLLGPEYNNGSFTCEPVNQLVHRLQLQANGVSFVGHRAANEQDREFLWSNDQWFRPVQVKTGLDGALYVVDMYRFLIEHPRFLSDEVRAKIDVRAGDDRGRIYRVVPKSSTAPPPAAQDDMTAWTPTQLARALDSSNGVRRDLAHQLLWWNVPPGSLSTQEGQACLEELRRILTHSAHPAARVQALCLLGEWKHLPLEMLLKALRDSHPAVRRHAVRVSEHRLRSADPDVSKIVASLRELASDLDPQVRLQVAHSVGEWNDPGAGPLLSLLLEQNAQNPWITSAVLSSLNSNNLTGIVKEKLSRLSDSDRLSESLQTMIRQALGMDAPTSVALLLQQAAIRPAAPERVERRAIWQLEIAMLVAEAITNQPDVFSQLESPFREMLDHDVQSIVRNWNTSESAQTSDEGDLVRLEFLGHATQPQLVLPILRSALRPQSTTEIQTAAINAWARLALHGHDETAKEFCSLIPDLTPRLQNLVMQHAQANPQLTRQLLDAIATSRIPMNLLDANARQFLTNHPDSAIQQQAKELFSSEVVGNWRELLPQYQGLDVAAGNSEQGQAVFQKHCASCHRVDNVGHTVGPDLRALTDVSVEGLLTSILNPHTAMDARYTAYLALTTDGQVLSGMLESESSNSVTLLAQEGKRFQLLRSEIDSLQRTGKSLMPEGLEKEIPPNAMRDLLHFLGAVARPIRYEYVGSSGAHPSYPDSDPPQKLVDRRYGTDRFNDMQWVNFRHVGQPIHQVRFDLGQELTLSRIRIVYGVNHQPGAIHAPSLMRIRLLNETGVVHEMEVGDWDDSPDGLGVYQIDRRTRLIEFPVLSARRVEVEWEGDAEWTSLAEIDFGPTDELLARELAESNSPIEQTIKPMDFQKTGIKSVDRIMELVAATRVGTPDEYRVIPEIWQEAIAAGKRNESAELMTMLDATLPRATEPLTDWQAVVVGGGIINGISQAGPYPGPRLAELLQSNPNLNERFQRSLILAAEMVEQESVPQGTRYDALRMIALRPWDDCQRQLRYYLQVEIPHELQQGSVSGLADVPHLEAAFALQSALDYLPVDLKNLAINSLVQRVSEDSLRSKLKRGDVLIDDLHPLLQAHLRNE
ncbi:MAG: HEAT repeat domain-containing protein [Planctomycetaceae bacterium]|nr:HEAT repeat domain-containing protein [Planctomycetaceae bacterium]